MYAFIIGKIESKNEDGLVISCGGIGYEILTSLNTISQIGNVGDTVKVLTYLHVREDAMVLYGFSSIEEKNLFLQLITVSGIGPKVALTILSSLSVKSIVSAISLGDVNTLASAKGVGKKTAERIVIELKNKVGVISDISNYNDILNLNIATPQTEAVQLLVSMGLTKFDASELVKRVSNVDDTTEQIVAKALKNMK